MSEPIERRLNDLREIAKKFAKAESERCYLEEFKKSKLSILMKRYESTYPSAVAQEREARADKEYIEVLEGLRDATEAATALKWELEIARIGASLYQTQQANKRAEIKAYGNS